jgi:hypothetical protein
LRFCGPCCASAVSIISSNSAMPSSSRLRPNELELDGEAAFAMAMYLGTVVQNGRWVGPANLLLL